MEDVFHGFTFLHVLCCGSCLKEWRSKVCCHGGCWKSVHVAFLESVSGAIYFAYFAELKGCISAEVIERMAD